MGEEILTPEQGRLINFLKAKSPFTQRFYLTGGTALSAFYLNHRYSEDLDFFSEQPIDLISLNGLLREAKSPCSIKKLDFQSSFNRNIFFLHLKGNKVIKVEFTYFPFARMEKGKRVYKLWIDSILDIAVNKVFVLTQDPRARDFVDLYFIWQKENFGFSDLLKKARAKFDWHIDPLQLGSQILRVKKLKDLPRMIKSLNLYEYHSFFEKEAKKLGERIFRK